MINKYLERYPGTDIPGLSIFKITRPTRDRVIKAANLWIAEKLKEYRVAEYKVYDKSDGNFLHFVMRQEKKNEKRLNQDA